VETELNERAYPASALRRTVDDRIPDRIAEWIFHFRAGGGTGCLPATAAVEPAFTVITVAAVDVGLALAAVTGAGAVAVAQERNEIARRREAEPQHRRILRVVQQLVDMVGVEVSVEANLARV